MLIFLRGMNTGRMEAFSDGVIAIIITIMVLDLHIPHGENLQALQPLIPVFLCYVLSFVYVGIYWNNHHHLLNACESVTGPILWANLHLLFWLSLFPFATAWMGENQFAAVPTALYGAVLLAAAIAFYVLQQAIIAGRRFDPAQGGGKRLERQALAGPVPRGGRRGDVLDALDRAIPVRAGGADLAGAGPAHRTGGAQRA